MIQSATRCELPQDPEAQQSSKPTCTILIAYDDYPAGQQAMNIFNHLSHRFTKEFEFRCKLWRFGVLDAPPMIALATRDAMDADLIVVSAGQCLDLPESVRKWIDGWSPHKLHSQSALVYLSSRDPRAAEGDRSPAAYLQEVAQRSGMEFFGYLGPDGSRLGPRLILPVNTDVDSPPELRGGLDGRGPQAVASGANMGYSPTVRVG